MLISLIQNHLLCWLYNNLNQVDLGNPNHNLMWLCERKDIPQKLFFDVEYENNKIIKIKPKIELYKLGILVDLTKQYLENKYSVVIFVNFQLQTIEY